MSGSASRVLVSSIDQVRQDLATGQSEMPDLRERCSSLQRIVYRCIQYMYMRGIWPKRHKVWALGIEKASSTGDIYKVEVVVRGALVWICLDVVIFSSAGADRDTMKKHEKTQHEATMAHG